MENLFKKSRDILTVPEVCVMLHICPSKAYRLLNEGRIEAFRCDKAWCIPKQSVIRYVEKQMKDNK